MKTINTLFVLLFFLPYITHAQFASVGAKWHYGTNEVNGYGKSFITYEITKDTLINSNTYSVVAFADSAGNNAAGVQFYLRKDSMKVYYWYNDAERILFDYNVLKGDTVILDVCGLVIDSETKQVKKDTILSLPFRYVRSEWQKNVLNINDSIEKYVLRQAQPSIGTMMLTYTNKLINTLYGYNLSLLNLNPITIPETSVSFRCYNDNSMSFKQSNEACDYTFVGINERLLKEKGFSIYPNPVSNMLHIKLQEDNIIQIAVYNINGQLLIKKENNEVLLQNGIDVSSLEKGIYNVVLSTNKDEVYSNRFVKE